MRSWYRVVYRTDKAPKPKPAFSLTALTKTVTKDTARVLVTFGKKNGRQTVPFMTFTNVGTGDIVDVTVADPKKRDTAVNDRHDATVSTADDKAFTMIKVTKDAYITLKFENLSPGKSIQLSAVGPDKVKHDVVMIPVAKAAMPSRSDMRKGKGDGDKPNGDKPNGDKPNGDKPNGDKPASQPSR